MVAGPVDPMPSLGLYVKERGSGEDEELGEERMPIAIFIASWWEADIVEWGGDPPPPPRGYEWAVVTRDKGTLGGVGGSGDKGDEPSPVSEDGGVMDAIEANMAAVLGGVTGIVGVTFPLPSRPAIEGLGLVIPLLGGLILFSFWRLLNQKIMKQFWNGNWNEWFLPVAKPDADNLFLHRQAVGQHGDFFRCWFWIG